MATIRIHTSLKHRRVVGATLGTKIPVVETPCLPGVTSLGAPEVLLLVNAVDQYGTVSACASLCLTWEDARDLAKRLNAATDEAERQAVAALPPGVMQAALAEGFEAKRGAKS